MSEPEVFLEHENVTITLHYDSLKVIVKCKDLATLERMVTAYQTQFGHSKVWTNRKDLEVLVKAKNAPNFERIITFLEMAKQILMLSEPERMKTK